jgi:CHAD domain-containing protein
MTKAMERWWLIQQELAKELAGKLVPQASDKVIHDFRVCVKKLRALAYPNEINNRFKKQCPHLKQCYRLTGHLRNVQMMQQKLACLGAWQINGFAEKQLNQLHQQHKKKLQHWLNKKQVHALLQEINTLHPDQHVEISANMAVPEPGLLPSLWHQCRKQCKKLLYQGQATNNSKNRKSLQLLQEVIGEWHDWECCMQWLRHQKGGKLDATLYLLLQQSQLKQQPYTAAILKGIHAHH